MVRQAAQRQNYFETQLNPEVMARPEFSHMVAYVDIMPASRKVIAHALAVARALQGELTLVEVIRAQGGGYTPIDPVQWDIRRNEAQAHVKLLAQEHGSESVIATEVLVGEAATQICNCVRENAATLTALCTHGNGDAQEWNLGNIAQRVADDVPGSVLLVPATASKDRVVEYTRILVPLDGSVRAESVLPAAIRIARTYDAELLLVHAISTPEVNPFESRDAKLEEHLTDHYEQASHDYLDTIKNRIAGSDLSVRTLILRGGDARRRLKRAIVDEAADLVILASHGHRGHADVPLGDVAAHLIAHTSVPLLMMRSQVAQRADHIYGKVVPTDLRLPRQSA